MRRLGEADYIFTLAYGCGVLWIELEPSLGGVCPQTPAERRLRPSGSLQKALKWGLLVEQHYIIDHEKKGLCLGWYSFYRLGLVVISSRLELKGDDDYK